VRIDDEDAFRDQAGRFLAGSDLLIVQEFLPTEFDWRVGVFDGRPLYACRYHMASAHWQIIRRDGEGRIRDFGKVETLALEDVPAPVLRAALRACRLVGDGLYGVDLKTKGRHCYVIEVNDNPSIDAGFEDRVAGKELYGRIMGGILERVERSKARRAGS
jgi:glutathione synthase/RimK-type ligase-like ATP-grasp enzyme